MEPPAEAWQKPNSPSKTGQSSPTLKLEVTRVSMVVERVRADGGEELDVLRRMKAAYIPGTSGERAVDLHPPVEGVVHD
ncbi:UNVERIFIED_CONTAM: hypothetical protein Sradi_4065700 [Sesamum radiatum]|uniref:Uncharacterized protein n=1 Tax=Sesamum radiatum TaxID=300843 RepID=A0AAW2PK30_SESRA